MTTNNIRRKINTSSAHDKVKWIGHKATKPLQAANDRVKLHNGSSIKDVGMKRRGLMWAKLENMESGVQHMWIRTMQQMSKTVGALCQQTTFSQSNAEQISNCFTKSTK